MKGIIFALLEEAVADALGEEAWEEAVAAIGSPGVYSGVATYPDAEMLALVGALADRHFDADADAALRWYGRELIARLSVLHPALFTPHARAESFLRSLNDHIHAEVQKMHPDAVLPWFDFDPPEAGLPTRAPDGTEQGGAGHVLAMGYRSERPLEALAEGMITGAAERYGQTVAIARRPGTTSRCVFVCTFGPAGPASPATAGAAAANG